MSEQVEAAADGWIPAAVRYRIAGAEHPFGKGTEQLELFLLQSGSRGAAKVPASP
jgi:hypothetical protein